MTRRPTPRALRALFWVYLALGIYFAATTVYKAVFAWPWLPGIPIGIVAATATLAVAAKLWNMKPSKTGEELPEDATVPGKE